MKKKITLIALAVCLILFFYSCNKSKEKTNLQSTVKVDSDKQILNIGFSQLNYEILNGVISNATGITAVKTGSSAVSRSIKLNSFDNPAPFISVYGSWNGQLVNEENISIEINSSADGSNWRGWMPFHANMDAEDVSANNQTFNNIELNADVQFVKFRVTFKTTTSQLQNASLYFFNPVATSAEMQAAINEESNRIKAEWQLADPGNTGVINKVQNAVYCSKPNFTARATWGARPAKSTPSYTTVNFLIIHHENGANTSTDWAARVRSVQSYHMDVNKWADIGYNYLVDPNGVAYEGRGGGENVIGAHNCGKNTSTIGVCMLGTYTSVRPTPVAEWTLKRIMAWKAKQRGIDVTATGYHIDRTIHRMTGHRASCATSCPGDALWNDLPRMRLNVKDIISQCN